MHANGACTHLTGRFALCWCAVWCAEQTDNLKQGVRKYGIGEWAVILSRFTFAPNRTSVVRPRHTARSQPSRVCPHTLVLVLLSRLCAQHLKDKWRTMLKRGEVTAAEYATGEAAEEEADADADADADKDDE